MQKNIHHPLFIRMFLITGALVLTAGLFSFFTFLSAIQSAQAQPLAAAESPGFDLDVTYISREPLYFAYCVEYPWDIPGQPGGPYLCPGTEDDRRWPEPGETVTFTAHIVNKGLNPSPPTNYTWYIDDSEVGSGTLPGISAAEAITITMSHAWPHSISLDGQRALGDHHIRFELDVVDDFDTNDSRQDAMNAMSFSIYFTPEMYEKYNQPVDNGYPHSAEDWIQQQIEQMNENFKNAVYTTTPNGSGLRVRINKIAVTDIDPGADGQHDGGWYIQGDYRDPVTGLDWGMIHELSHQVSLIDLYAIGAAAPATWVNDQSGNPVNFSFTWPNPGLMGGGDVTPYTEPQMYSSHSAGGSNTFHGYRNGYYGSYQYDIPLNNYFKVLDSQGYPAVGVEVNLYQRAGPDDWSGMMGIDGTPEITGTTDASGIFALPNRPVGGELSTENGHSLHDNPFGVVDIIGNQNLFLVQLTRGSHEEFFWLDITAFNLAYWAGHTDSHTFEIQSHIPVEGAPVHPEIISTRVTGDQVELCWQPSPTAGVVGYRIYRAVPPYFHYLPADDMVSGPCATDTMPAPGEIDGHVYTMVAVDGAGRESGFSNFAWVTNIINPTAVVVNDLGFRTILDRQYGYSLIHMASSGRSLQNISSVHYHLENSSYMSRDAYGNLLINHPGDWYDPRHSIRIAAPDGTPLLEFGQQGSDPGEFETPTGVASWGPPCTVDIAYDEDEHTLLLLHFDGSYIGTQGEAGTPIETGFVTGRFGQGVLIDSEDRLSYETSGNISLQQGSIEFWFLPNWEGSSGEAHGLFETGDDSSPMIDDRLRIQIDDINNLRFMVMVGDGVYPEYGVSYNINHWQIGEWHHVAATWEPGAIALYVDGFEVDRAEGIELPDELDEVMQVGSLVVNEPFRADGVIDELRISDIPRVGNNPACNLILVADSGNQRIQAFDSLGNYLSAYGELGSASGQFASPQGLAVDPAGRVVVVDRDNNRLVVLAFDGEKFNHLHDIDAGLTAPTGIAIDPYGNIFVADTGNNRIVKLNAAGEFVQSFTEPNDGYIGKFNAPEGLAIDNLGNLIIADTGNMRVVAVYLPQLYLPLVSH